MTFSCNKNTGGSYRIVASVLFVILMSLRAPDILSFHFWAEDLNVFFNDQRASGIASIIEPYAGYMHLVPRLVSLITGFMPADYTPVAYTISVMAVTWWCSFIIARTINGGIGVFVATVSFVIVPGWAEPIGSITNLQWIMAPALLSLILSHSRIPKLEAVAFAFLASFSGPFALAFGPIIAIVAAIRFKRSRELDLVAITAGLGGLTQLVEIVKNGAASDAKEPPELLWLIGRILIYPFQYSLFPAIAVVLLLLTLMVGQRRSYRFGLLAGVIFLTAVVVAKFYHQPRVFESGLVALRYWYVQGILWILIGASALSENLRLAKVLGALGIVAMLSNVVASYPIARPWPWPTEDWSAFLEAARHGPATYRYAPGWVYTIDLSK